MAFFSATLAFLGFFALTLFMMMAGRLPLSVLHMMPVIFGGAAVLELGAVVFGYKSRHRRLGWIAMLFGISILLVIAMFFIQGRVI